MEAEREKKRGRGWKGKEGVKRRRQVCIRNNAGGTGITQKPSLWEEKQKLNKKGRKWGKGNFFIHRMQGL